jgi:hypothetical protein
MPSGVVTLLRSYRNGHLINERYEALFPRNCPVIEKTADGVVVGNCTFYLSDGKTCPRHGNVKWLESMP